MDISTLSTSGNSADEYKLQISARLIECLILLKDFESVENILNQVAKMLPNCEDEALKLEFKVCLHFDLCICLNKFAQALVLDSKEKFLEAGQRYLELSLRFQGVLSESRRMEFLEHALISTILGGTSQQQARLLTNLYKYDRCRTLSAFPILEKMYNQRLVSRECIGNLRPLIIKYYTDLFDGENNEKLRATMERVVVEHNLIAASKVYRNIKLENLAELLGIETEQVSLTFVKHTGSLNCIINNFLRLL